MSSKIVAVNILFFYYYFSEKIRLDISCESSARQMIHMKYQALISLKNKEKIMRMSSPAGAISFLRVN